MQPLVSILIPVYNREKIIGESISSALAQSFTDFEIVIVDNQSTDGTWQVCEQFAEQDARIRIFRNKENIGPVRNWQRCISEAKGRYAKLLFSDDLMAPRALELCIPFLCNEDVGFVFAPVIIGSKSWEGNQLFSFSDTTGTYSNSEFLREVLFDGKAPVSPAAALFRLEDLHRNLYLSVPSRQINDFESHGAGVDMLIYLLTAVQYPQVAFIAEPLTFFRSHPESISISTNQNYLYRAYRQAKIWFADNYLAAESVSALKVFEWKRQCKREKTWRWPNALLEEYSDCLTPISVADVLRILFMRTDDWKNKMKIRLKVR